MYYDLGTIVIDAVAPEWARVAFYGYAAAVEVVLCGAARACGVPHGVVYLYAVARKVAAGASPVVCAKVAVAHCGGTNDEAAKAVVELSLLQMYLRDAHGLCLAHGVGYLILAYVCSLSYADELPIAARLVVRIYGAVKDYVGMVA